MHVLHCCKQHLQCCACKLCSPALCSGLAEVVTSSHLTDRGLLFYRMQATKNSSFTDTKTACYVTADNLANNPVPDTQPIGLPTGSECKDPDAHVFWDQ